MFKDKELVAIMAHLVITLVILAAYLATIIINQPDPTLQNLSLLAAGYWFGAVGGRKAVEKYRQRKGSDSVE